MLGPSGDSARQERMLQIASRIGLSGRLGLLVAFPVARWRMAHSSPLLVLILIATPACNDADALDAKSRRR